MGIYRKCPCMPGYIVANIAQNYQTKLVTKLVKLVIQPRTRLYI